MPSSSHIAQKFTRVCQAHGLIVLPDDPNRLPNIPLSGRRVTEYDFNQIREVIEGSYRIIYHIKSDQVDVLAVIHGAMNILHSSEEADD